MFVFLLCPSIMMSHRRRGLFHNIYFHMAMNRWTGQNSINNTVALLRTFSQGEWLGWVLTLPSPPLDCRSTPFFFLEQQRRVLCCCSQLPGAGTGSLYNRLISYSPQHLATRAPTGCDTHLLTPPHTSSLLRSPSTYPPPHRCNLRYWLIDFLSKETPPKPIPPPFSSPLFSPHLLPKFCLRSPWPTQGGIYQSLLA